MQVQHGGVGVLVCMLGVRVPSAEDESKQQLERSSCTAQPWRSWRKRTGQESTCATSTSKQRERGEIGREAHPEADDEVGEGRRDVETMNLMADELHLEEEERKFPTLWDGSGSGSSFRTTRAARCFHSRAQDIPIVTMEMARCSCSSHGWLEWRWRRRWDGERRAAARGGRRGDG